MFLTILGYVLAFVAIAVVAPLLGIIVFSLTSILPKSRALAPALMATTSGMSSAAAILTFVWVASIFDIQLAILMFLIPLALSIRNDIDRIRRASTGATPVRLAVGENYDAAFQVKMEYGYLAGDVAGVVVPLLFLGPLPFL